MSLSPSHTPVQSHTQTLRSSHTHTQSGPARTWQSHHARARKGGRRAPQPVCGLCFQGPHHALNKSSRNSPLTHLGCEQKQPGPRSGRRHGCVLLVQRRRGPRPLLLLGCRRWLWLGLGRAVFIRGGPLRQHAHGHEMAAPPQVHHLQEERSHKGSQGARRRDCGSKQSARVQNGRARSWCVCVCACSRDAPSAPRTQAVLSRMRPSRHPPVCRPPASTAGAACRR